MSLPLVTIFTGNSNSGKYCIEELFKRYPDKSRVRGVFRSEEKSQPFREKYPHLEIVTGCDASKPETLAKAYKGAQAALIVTTHDMSSGFDKDAQLTETMINHAVESGITYIVLVASFTVNHMKEMPIISSRFYPSEVLLEKLGNEKGIQWTVLRGGCFMENLLPQFKKIKQDSVFSAANMVVPMNATVDIGKSAAACFASGNFEQHNRKKYLK